MATVKQNDLSGYSTEELEQAYRKNVQIAESSKANVQESAKFRKAAEMNNKIQAELDQRNKKQE